MLCQENSLFNMKSKAKFDEYKKLVGEKKLLANKLTIQLETLVVIWLFILSQRRVKTSKNFDWQTGSFSFRCFLGYLRSKAEVSAVRSFWKGSPRNRVTD